MDSGQMMVSDEPDFDVSKVSCDVDNSGYVADHETDETQVPETTLASDTGDIEKVALKQRIATALIKRLINSILAEVLRYVITIASVPRNFWNALADGVKSKALSSLDNINQKAHACISSVIVYGVNNFLFFSTGMDMLTNGLKIYEIAIRRHMKCVRRIRRQTEVCSCKSLVKSSCLSGDVNDEPATDETQPTKRRAKSPERRKSVLLQICRWFTGPLTREHYHFSTEETIEDILNKIETESYHSSQDPDYEPSIEPDNTFSSYSSVDACELEEDNVELDVGDNTPTAPEPSDIEETSAQEPQRSYHETNM